MPNLDATATALAEVQESYLTTTQAAEVLGVTVRTIQLWAESGLLETWKTQGGHRRLLRKSVELLRTKRSGESGRRPNASLRVPTSAQTSRSHFSVLVVDDDAMSREILVSMLRSWQLPLLVSSATDGYSGLLSIGRSTPDLVVSDLQMPGMDGFRMIRHLRASPEPFFVDVIAVTALSRADVEKQGGLPIDVPVLSKPVDENQVRELVTHFIRKRLDLAATGVPPYEQLQPASLGPFGVPA